MDVYKCKNCGLVRLSKFMDNAEEFYENSEMWSGHDITILDEIRKSTFTDDRRRADFVRNRIENKTVLDFGCGAGGFLNEAKTTAKRVLGIEWEQRMRNALNGEGIRCFRSAEEMEDETKADVITMFHVLEHLKDPIEVLKSLKGKLVPGGIVIIEVPNADDALLSVYGSEAFADFTYWECHLYLFDNRTLETVAKRAGYNVNFIRQIQRYPLANHLYWLSGEKPGGHVKWEMLTDDGLDAEYGKKLACLGIADTIVMEITPE